jgi:BASS family bile acid:Na+ symporter
MRRLLAPLAFAGRYGTQGFALSLAVGILLPGLATAARPLLSVTIFVFLVLTFARADLPEIARVLRRPAKLALACAWLLLAPPLLVGFGLALVGRAAVDPGLVLGLAVVAAAPPILSAPAIAILLGLEPTLLLAATVLTTLASPLTAPVVAEWVAGAVVPLDAVALAGRLAGFIGGSLVVAAGFRRLLGHRRIVAHAQAIDGAGVLCYVLFAIAAMDGVAEAAWNRPLLVAGFVAIAFAISLAGLALASIGLAVLKPAERFLLGYATGHRNMGLLIASLGAGTPETTFLFFALAQFPIYLMPQVLKPLAARLAARPSARVETGADA